MKTTLPTLSLLALLTANVSGQNQTNAQPSTLTSQRSTNRVLELDGNGSYVELPPNIFTNLTQGTVEAWVKWRNSNARSAGRFFSFGQYFNDMGVGRFGRPNEPTLSFFISSIPPEVIKATPRASELMERVNFATVDGLIEWEKWYHIAAVSGPGV